MGRTTLHYILGTDNYAYLLYLLFWAGVGVLVSLFVHYLTRKKQKNPKKFSTRFWAKDNWVRLSLTTILVIVALRFSEGFTGFHQGGLTSFLIGAFNDRLIGFLKAKRFLTGKR